MVHYKVNGIKIMPLQATHIIEKIMLRSKATMEESPTDACNEVLSTIECDPLCLNFRLVGDENAWKPIANVAVVPSDVLLCSNERVCDALTARTKQNKQTRNERLKGIAMTRRT